MSVSVNPTPLANLAPLQATRPGTVEAVNQPLYDFATYAFAGTTQQYRFFALPQGQGTPPKTLADTNMTLAGQLPAGTSFEVRAIEVAVFPGVLPALGQQNSAGAAGVAQFVNDVWTLFRNGYLSMRILAKDYLQVAPIGQFPYTKELSLAGFQSDTTTAGAAQLNRVAYAAFGGQQFAITPVLLTPNLNFDVTLNFPTTTALPSGVDARLGVILRGIYNRNSQ